MKRTSALAIGFASLLGGFFAATQVTAACFGHTHSLGWRVSVGGVQIYPPWAYLNWVARWGATYPDAFRVGTALAAGGLLVGILPVALVRSTPVAAPVGEREWATLADMKRAGLLTGRGVVVGRFRGRLLTFDGPEHQLVAGATRSGKGVGHVVPTLLSWPASALVFDPKIELWKITSGFRSTFSHCLHFKPTSLESVRYNPLLEVRRGCQEIPDCQNISEMLVNPDGSKQQLDVWDQHAAQLLTALQLHVLYTEPDDRKHLGVVRELLLDAEATLRNMAQTPHRLNAESGLPEPHPEVARVALELIKQAPKFAAGVRATAQGYLSLFADEIVCRNVSVSDFAASDLVCAERPMTLYLCPVPADAARLRPLMRLVTNQILRAMLGDISTDNRGRPKRHRLLALIDELPALGRLEFLTTSLRQMSGFGVKAQLVVQSLSDLAEVYGPYNTILDNCHVIAAFACADPLTQQRLSQMTGTTTEYREGFSRRRSLMSHGSHSVSHTEQVRPLLQPGDVRRLSNDEQLLFVTGHPPMRTRKVRYYADPEFQGRLLPPACQAAGPDVPGSLDARNGASQDWLGERAKGPLIPTNEILDAPQDEENWHPPVPNPSAGEGRGDEYAL